MKKLLIVLLADSNGHENLARALHALLYAKQAHAAGVSTKLIFDGGGTEWAAALPSHQHLRPLYQQLVEAGVIEGVCEFCAKAFEVYDQLKDGEVQLVSEDQGHPNIGAKLADGWQVMTL
ncbi:MAG: hypothetical protein COU69_02775 [Candidatus Pacebacteria bacterium CG10_big_fil_rev_8_21_14_0_10_56_10]|nr:MAG: hypothetical protein COU69_02775 [Candidatus Pacebacteria bacterium CG10_big_fil_rev_8_21_14_0_10_56_10]